MGLTYTVQSAWDLATKMVAGTPITTALQIQTADQVASEMWTPYPWYRAKTTIAPGSIPCVNGQQDYTVPTNIYRLTKASLVHTAVTPNDWRELDVVEEADVDLIPRSGYAIRSISLQAAVGMLRLGSAISISSGDSWEIQGEYQVNPTKLTSMSQNLWFDDQYFTVFAAGVLYYAYKLSNDARAGTAQFNDDGRTTYTGQYGEYMSKLKNMRVAEDMFGVNSVFPSENLSNGRDDTVLTIFGVT